MMERPKQSPPPCLSGAPRIKSKKVGEYELKHTLGEGEISKPLVFFCICFLWVKTRTRLTLRLSGAWGKVKLAIHRYACPCLYHCSIFISNMFVSNLELANIAKQSKGLQSKLSRRRM